MASAPGMTAGPAQTSVIVEPSKSAPAAAMPAPVRKSPLAMAASASALSCTCSAIRWPVASLGQAGAFNHRFYDGAVNYPAVAA